MFQSATPCFPWYPVSEELADAPPFSAFAPQGSPEEWFPSLSVCPTLVSQPVSSFVFGKQLFQLGIRFLLKREPLVYFNSSCCKTAVRRTNSFPSVRSALCKIPPAQLKNDASSWLFQLLFQFLLPSCMGCNHCFGGFTIQQGRPQTSTFVQFCLLSFFFCFFSSYKPMALASSFFKLSLWADLR